MKPILFWTIRRMYGEFDVIGVTLERQGHFYGRDCRGRATHMIETVTYGRFDDQAAADAKLAGVKAIMEEAAAESRPHSDAIATINCLRDRKIKAWLTAPVEAPAAVAAE